MRGRAGVAQDVREALLEDTVGGQVEAGRQCPALPGYVELDGQAGVAHVLDQRADLVHARLWSEGGAVLAGPQQAEHAAHLAERLARGLFGRQQLRRVGWAVMAKAAAHGPRLHRDHADRVGDDVVQFARDPRALLRDRRARPVLALVLEPSGARLELVGAPRPLTQARAERPDHGHDRAQEDEVPGHRRGHALGDERVLDHQQRRQQTDPDRQAAKRLATRTERAHRRERHDKRGRHIARVDGAARELHGEERYEDQDEDPDRRGATPRERYGHRQGGRHVGDRRRPGLCGPDLELRDDGSRSAPAEIRDDVQKLLAGMRQRAGLEAPDEVTEAEVSAADERVNAFEERACG